MNPITVGIVGCGYWGPNLLRNFMETPGARVQYACDLNPARLSLVKRRYPTVQTTQNYFDLLTDSTLEAVVISTPVRTHFKLAKDALNCGKHVLIEKPVANTVKEAEELIALAESNRLTLMVDHTFVYTGAVRKIKEIIESDLLGEILYFDSVRVNLGVFQDDVNVLWDLAPHDLSIMDYLLRVEPKRVLAVGSCHVREGFENIAYLTLQFDNSLIAHFHFNWLAPVKIRMTLISGSKKMIVYNDLEPIEKVRVYDKGVVLSESEEAIHQILVSYRTGDMWSPNIDMIEALAYVCQEFIEAISAGRRPLTDGEAGLRVLRILEAAQDSMQKGGTPVSLI